MSNWTSGEEWLPDGGAVWRVHADESIGHMPPKTEGILESSLYVEDVSQSARFYQKIFGFQIISDFGERAFCALEAGTRRCFVI